MSILVLNAGSSSLKFSLFGAGTEPVVRGLVDWNGGQDATLTIERSDGSKTEQAARVTHFRDAVTNIVAALRNLQGPGHTVTAVGHRVVHGGEEFRQSVRIDERVKTALERLSVLAPLHNPPALEVIKAAEQTLPDAPQVAVFDTAFHATLPRSTYLYPVPYEWYANGGVRRFGFHGISVAYCTSRAAAMLGHRREESRFIICHLGNGCSATAVRDGASVATTMGFTPLEGLMMGTRSGSVDPGLLLYMLDQGKKDGRGLDQALNHESGLLGISGVSSDYRNVEEAAKDGNERAALALEMYAERVRAAIGALATYLGRLDALVFTAGVGENSASLRRSVCSGLECLGVRLDHERNENVKPDGDVGADDSRSRILVIRTREDLLIAREAQAVIA